MSVSKLLCMMLSPIFRILTNIYRLVVILVSYAIIGLYLICLLAIGAELFHYGITKEAFAYLVLAIIGIAVRFILLLSLSLIENLSDRIQMIAQEPVSDKIYQNEDFYF